MKRIALALIFMSTAALAHVEPGTYLGTTPEGHQCVMTAEATYFENNQRHPLNERIKITVGSRTFTVAHPSVIDSSKGTVGFNHDLFQGVVPTATGAAALEIAMEHSETFEGPRSFIVMEDFWRDKRRESMKCDNLKHVSP